jgi:hypothetical protein
MVPIPGVAAVPGPAVPPGPLEAYAMPLDPGHVEASLEPAEADASGSPRADASQAGRLPPADGVALAPLPAGPTPAPPKIEQAAKAVARTIPPAPAVKAEILRRLYMGRSYESRPVSPPAERPGARNLSYARRSEGGPALDG